MSAYKDNCESPPLKNHKDEEPKIETIDTLVHDLGPCGPFQILVVLLGYGSLGPVVWNFMMMAFGGYSPRWTCADHNFTTVQNLSLHPQVSISPHLESLAQRDYDSAMTTLSISSSSPDYSEFLLGANVSESPKWLKANQKSCALWSACTNVKFEPIASTVVTEWNLICDNSWIPPIIISVQMGGVLIASYIGGQIGDRYGRKFSIYGGMAISIVTNIIAVFSVSWQMYAVVRVFLGFCGGVIVSTSFVFASEFLTGRWRGFLGTFPSWSIGAGGFALCVMALKDWRHIHIATAILSFLYFLPVFWIPESMRFLAVHGKIPKANRVVKKIAGVNKKPVPKTDVLLLVAEKEAAIREKQGRYTYIDLFRKNLIKHTLIMGGIWFSMSMTYYVISFGVKALSGDFYVNFLILSVAPIPVRLIAVAASAKLGRKVESSIFLFLSSLCCFALVAVQLLASVDIKGVATTGLAISANMLLEAGWGVVVVFNVESCPTGVRNLSYAFFNAAARIGGIVAPFLIPKDDVPVYGTFLILAVLLTTCWIGILLLSETKGKPLRDNISLRKIKDEGPIVLRGLRTNIQQ